MEREIELAFEAKDPKFTTRVQESFDKQKLMHTMGARVAFIEAGYVVLEMPFSEKFTQQHGFLHAGAVTTMMDSAAGYAAFSLMPLQAEVLTIEFKTNLMSPARGESFRFEGAVIKPGRTITFCEAVAYAIDASGSEKKIATMNATMMSVMDQKGVNA